MIDHERTSEWPESKPIRMGWPCWMGSAFVLLACALVVLLFAYGCAAVAPEEQTRTVTTKVDVPVAVACISRKDQIPYIEEKLLKDC
jgi:hypothetical protein